MKKNKFVFNLILCSIFFASCFTLKAPSVKGVENLRLGELTKEMNLKFDVILKNPNNYGLKLRSMQMSLFMDDSLASEISMDKKTRIAANSEVAIPLTVKPKALKIPKIGWSLVQDLFGGSNKKIRLDGEMVVSKFIFRKKFKFSTGKK
jgi:LEA14-like dessication related protein